MAVKRTAKLCCAGALIVMSGLACADVATEIGPLRLDRTDEGLFVSTTVKFELPLAVEDALLKGVSMYFLAEVDLLRDRWYWYDKKVATSARHMRLSFQPLTRRWRLTSAPGVISNSGLGVTLGQNFDTLDEAMATIKRFSHWKVSDVAGIEPQTRYNVEFRFKLDVAQLPRPFQIGTVGQAEWRIDASRNQRLNLGESSP